MSDMSDKCPTWDTVVTRRRPPSRKAALDHWRQLACVRCHQPFSSSRDVRATTDRDGRPVLVHRVECKREEAS